MQLIDGQLLFLFDASLEILKQHNIDCHCCEHGNDKSVETEINQTLRNLYGKKNMVKHDDIDIYIGVNLNMHLKGSLESRKNWIS